MLTQDSPQQDCFTAIDESSTCIKDSSGSRWIKRSFDFVLSLILFTITSPVFVVSIFLAKFQSRGPVFYKATRVGKNGKLFKMYKFRTMVENADQIGIGLTTHRDVRVTRIGGFLRKLKLDELPNLINVVKGDMSLIGPRPESPDYVKFYSERQKQVLQVKPGITGPSQIVNRDEEKKLKAKDNPEHYYITELMPEKLELDLHYVATQSFLRDIGWLIKTLWVIFFPLKNEKDYRHT